MPCGMHITPPFLEVFEKGCAAGAEGAGGTGGTGDDGCASFVVQHGESRVGVQDVKRS